MNVFASTTFADLDSKATDVVKAMLDHGIHGIELGSIHCYEDNLVDRLADVPAEFLVHNYFPPPRESFVVNLASLNDAIRDKSVAHALHCLEVCVRLGAPLYTVHPGFLSDPDAPGSSSTYDFAFRAASAQGDRYEAAYRRFAGAMEILAAEARSFDVGVAVETQGSVSHADQVLLQRPDEVHRFLSEVEGVGVNLNLGHLNLSARVFKFDRMEFIGSIAGRISAMEISHNDGEQDEHRPLEEGAWYWEAVCDPRLLHAPVILECRDTPIAIIQRDVRLLEAARAFCVGADSGPHRT